MEGLVHLSGEDPNLARAELSGALRALESDPGIEEISDQVILLDGSPPKGLASRMGLCHFTGILTSRTSPAMEDILQAIDGMTDEFDINGTISVKVKVPASVLEISSSSLFESVVSLLTSKGFRVRHRDPDQWIFILVEEEAFAGRVCEWSNRGSVRSRRGSRLPFNRPIVMEPKIARAMVNISGLRPDSTILDPFLGPAGLAIEAASMGHKVIGIERDPEIYHGARVNVLELGLDDRIRVHNGDSRKLREYPWGAGLEHIDGIITDPPFGRSAATMGEDPGELLREVLETTGDLMEKGAPLVLDSPSMEMIDPIDGFEIQLVVPFRVHKSMTRHVALLRKK